MSNKKKVEVEATVLPADSNSEKVSRVKVILSDAVVNSLAVSREAELVEKGEVESVVEVDGKQVVVGNEEVSEA